MSAIRNARMLAFIGFGALAVSAASVLLSRKNFHTRAPETLDVMTIESVTGEPAQLGSSAPEITWRESRRSGVHRLSDYRGKPVAVCLGSGTCGPFRTNMNLLKSIIMKYPGRLTTFLIYTQDAHPEISDKPYMLNSKTVADRSHAACDLNEENVLGFPILIDTLQNDAAKKFNALPSRIYVLDEKGTVVSVSSERPSSNMAVGAVGMIEN